MDFFDYGTEVFREVRRALQIPADDYARAFQAVEMLLQDFSPNESRKAFREIISSGASGSYFYFTPNRKYIVKTIARREKDALIAFSEAYLAHCRACPRTLIQYLGCHSIRLPLNTCKVYFVVMANVLPGTVDMTFDLKGATSNRQRARGPQLEQLRSGELSASSFKTLLDKDWIGLGLHLALPPLAARALAEAILADARFLAEQRLMDYSLLVGICHPAETPDGRPNPKARARSNSMVASAAGMRGALQGTDGAHYYIGLIDVLEVWRGLKWPVQSVVLQLFFRYVCCNQWYNPQGITALRPAHYGLRFREFFVVHVLGLPPDDPLLSDQTKSWQPFW